MPELPEVETVRRTLLPHLEKKEVQKVHVASPSLRRPLNADTLRRLERTILVGISRRGKFLIFEFGEKALLCHLGMSGRLLLRIGDGPSPPHTHVIFDFSGGTQLLYVDPRRFGLLQVFPSKDLGASPLLAKLGPEPFDPHLVAMSLWRQRSRSRRRIRDVLLDQTVVAGLGNIYVCEALFAAQIAPSRRISTLSRREVQALAEVLPEILGKAIEAGGTTLRDKGFHDALGEQGYFAVNLAVYGRAGQLCPACGTPIVRKKISSRSAFYCRNCQS